MVNNLDLILPFVPEKNDGDTFLYTELLDRKRNNHGNNRMRLLRTFRHHDRKELETQFSLIKELCDKNDVRAYIRLSPRSYAQVGKFFARNVVDAALAGSYEQMPFQYASACGKVSIHDRKMWLYDIDYPDVDVGALGLWREILEGKGVLRAILPSAKGEHWIVKPHDQRGEEDMNEVITCHKDNPTNLYIP